MAVILAGVYSLAQHQQLFNTNPEIYRPQRCPSCGCSGMWCHGCYTRKADREGGGAFNPTLIPRFLCPQRACRKSCSVLPECIPPRRWYPWSIQQTMLLLLLTGRLSDEQVKPHVRTVWRWRARLKASFDIHRFYLCSHFALLGQYGSAQAFWQACFALMPLSGAMLIVHQGGGSVP